jgi:hypothetical protein
MEMCVRTGNHVVQTVYQSSHIWTWKESEADRSLMDVRTGCWEVRTDASWNRSFSIQCRVRTERYVVRMDDAGLSGIRTVWHVVQTNGAMDRWTSGRLTGNLKSSIFFAVQSLLKMLWQVESLFTASLHISDFVQAPNEAKILTISFLAKFQLYPFCFLIFWLRVIDAFPHLMFLKCFWSLPCFNIINSSDVFLKNLKLSTSWGFVLYFVQTSPYTTVIHPRVYWRIGEERHLKNIG